MSLRLTVHGGAVCFPVRVVPRARVNALQGIADGVLLVRLNAPPVEGKANAALCALLAEVLGVRRSAVAVRTGEKSRHKTVEVAGMDPETIRERLESNAAM